MRLLHRVWPFLLSALHMLLCKASASLPACCAAACSIAQPDSFHHLSCADKHKTPPGSRASADGARLRMMEANGNNRPSQRTGAETEECCVCVAVHIRPLIASELAEGCQTCLQGAPSKPEVPPCSLFGCLTREL